VAQDEDSGGDENERKESADVGEVGERADVEQAGGDADDKSGDPGGDVGGAEARVDFGEDFGQQAVTGHGKPDAGLSDLEDENGGDHTEHGSDDDCEMRVVQD